MRTALTTGSDDLPGAKFTSTQKGNSPGWGKLPKLLPSSEKDRLPPLQERIVMSQQVVERGKPAEYGQELIRRRSRITASLVPLAGRRILDFGAGNGAQTVSLREHGCSIVACDIVPDGLNVLARYLRDNAVDSVAAVLCDGAHLPFPDGSFDNVVSYAVLEHVEDETSSLREMLRVLKVGGQCVISVPNKWWIFETHGARLPLLPWNRVPFFSWLPRSLHRRFAKARIYTRSDIVRLLEQHNCEIQHACFVTAPMDVLRPPFLQKLLRRTVFRKDQTRLPVLATEVLVCCLKK